MHMLSHSFIYIYTFSLQTWTYGPEIINYMVLKYMGMSSSDQIPFHKKLCMRLKVLGFFNDYIRLGNENVYINHTFC